MTHVSKDELAPGTVFGRHTIVRRIGSGGMGAVYEAIHNGLKKRVAIKVLHAATGQSSDIVTRFLREGEAAARIHHPHVVDIYDVGEEGGTVYLAMEYLEGEDLASMLRKEGVLSPNKVAEIMVPVCAAIGAAHEEKVVHRDLKPANIFLCRRRAHEVVPKVLDFGISKIINDTQSGDLTSSGALLGTPFYMSPEQARGSKIVTAASDQYSLGVILYQCVTGEKPFFADSMYQVLHAIVEGKFSPPRARRPDLPERFERIIMTAMANRPEDRFPTVMHLGHELLPFAGDRMRALWEPTLSAATSLTPLPNTLFGRAVDAPTAPIAPPTPVPPAPIAAQPSEVNLYAEPLNDSGSRTRHQSLNPPSGIIQAPQQSRTLLFAGAAALALAIAVLLGVVLKGGPAEEAPLVVPVVEEQKAALPTKPTSFRAVVAVAPESAMVEVDGVKITLEAGRLERTFMRDGSEHRLRVSAPGYESQSVVFRDAAPPERVELAKLALPATEPRGASPEAGSGPDRTNGGAQDVRRESPKEKKSAEAQRPRPKPRENKAPSRGANDAPILR